MSRPRAPLAHTLLMAGVAAATTWFTLLSWGTFTTDAAKVTVPLFFMGALIAGIGGVARWLRVPTVVTLVVQVVVGAMCVLGSVAGSVIPTSTTLDEFIAAFQDAIATAQAFQAPIPPGVPPIAAILLTGGVATFIIIDLLAGALRRIPLAGLALLTVYSVPVSITGNGASWFAFIAMSIGFLTLLFLVHSEQVERWGRGMGSDTAGDHADPSSFGVRTGAVRGSAAAIGATATAMALVLPILVPTLEVTLFEGAGPGTRQIEVADPMVDLRRDLNRGEDIPLLWVTTPEKNPSYFRFAVLTRFNGNTWTPGDRDIPENQVARGEMPALIGVASGTKRTEAEYHVRVSSDFESDWLPTTPQVSSMTVLGDWRYDTSTMDFMSTDDGVNTADMTYDFTGVDVVPDPELMDNSVSGGASVRSTYLEVPASISSDIRTLAAGVTGDEVTRFRKARALQQWFREDGGFEYSTASLDDEEQGSLTSFLAESGRVGYCEQFAASMAIMARIIGIPARVAVGFLQSKPAGANQYEFSAHDLHAWPELFFPGAGWVRFEPTPRDGAETLPSYTTASLPPVASNSPSTSAARPEDQLPSRGASADPDAGANSDDGSSFPWLVVSLTMLGVLLVAALVLLPGFVRRKRRERRLLGDIEDLWLELRDHAVDLGHGWPHGRSPRATGAWLADWFGSAEGDATLDRPRHGAEQNPDAAQALDRLVEQIERARYSRSGASVDNEQAMLDTRTIEAALDRGVGPRVRRRSRWLPRSLRRAAYVPAGEVVIRETSDSVRS
jgi:transglutaminase-like putative cysteine protease